MPIVDRDMLQSLSHAPLVGRWCDSLYQFAYSGNIAAGVSSFVCATWTVPAGKLAVWKLCFVICVGTTQVQQLTGGFYTGPSGVNANPLFVVTSQATLMTRITQTFDVCFPAGTELCIQASNSDAAGKTFKCTALLELYNL